MVDDLEQPMDLVSQPGEVNAAMWAKAAPPLPVAEKADAAADEEENVESSDGPAILGARRRPRSESDGDVAHDSTTVYQKKGGLMARDRQPLGDSEATATAWNLSWLPKAMGEMDNLNNLSISGCYDLDKSTIPKFNSSLILLPQFEVQACNRECGSNLIYSTSELEISKMENVVTVEEARTIRLKEKNKISKLILKWTRDARTRMCESLSHKITRMSLGYKVTTVYPFQPG
uniref:R13L1/DRL21-like LRR repeat region domain-containing protein n=1 Tax=Oryza nivara TaxID=4536 RepID=A0A0E0IZJ2_ORYNI